MRLSIVTPSFNQGEYVAATVESVLAQKATADVQYIVVDGLSTDGTQTVLERFRDVLDHLLIEPDDGQADALRKGFELADGEICAYLNSDDTLLPGTAAWVCDYFARHPQVDVLYSHRLFADENGRIFKFWLLPPHSDYLMSRWDYIPQETCFWRRSVVERFGGIDPSFQFAMDYEFFARIMPHVRFRRVNRFLATFRQHSASKTSQLIDTVGQREITRVRDLYGISISRFDLQIARLLHIFIDRTDRALRRLLLHRERWRRFAP